MTPLDSDPRSRHSHHVTDREDLPGVEPWSPAALHDDPPRVLGVAGQPALRVDGPVSDDPEADAVTDGPGQVTASPALDVPDDLDEAPPPLGGRRAGQPADTERGTPG